MSFRNFTLLDAFYLKILSVKQTYTANAPAKTITVENVERSNVERNCHIGECIFL